MKMTPQEIEEYIEEQWKNPAIRQMVALAGLTKDEWIERAIQGSEKHFERCENCKRWKCDAISNLEDKYPAVVKTWYEFGTNCELFLPKEGAHA